MAVSRSSQVASDFWSGVWANAWGRAARVVLIAAISAAIVTGIEHVDAKRQQTNQTALALRWTRQIVAQAESLALAADARGEQEPLSWAARILSQGTDSRIIYANNVQVPLPVAAPESYSLDPHSGIFDYTRIFDQQGGYGIHIRLYTSHTGIFGARTVFQHDLTVASLFLVIYGLLYFCFATARASAGRAEPETEPVSAPSELTMLRPIIAEWASDSKASLTDLGVHIREMVRAGTQLSQGARETKELLYSLRLKAHAQLDILHGTAAQRGTQAGQGELTALASEVEALIKRTPAMDAGVQQLLKKLLSTTLRQAEMVSDTELRVESLATDADLAFETFETMSRATEAMSAEIKATTEGMHTQARKIGELKKRSGTES